MDKELQARSHRLFWFTALCIAVISTVGWMRFQQALRHWYYLIDLGIWPHPLYLATTGGLIGIAYSAGLLLHLLRIKHTALYLRITGILLIAWLWVDRIFIGIRNAFGLLLAGTIFLTISLLMFDLLFFQKVQYPMEGEKNGAEN